MSRARPAPARERLLALLGAVLFGAAVGALGTVVHMNLVAVGDGAWAVPWGAALALTLVGSTQLWWSRRADSPAAGGLLGAVAFTVAWAVQTLPEHDRLGVPLDPVFAQQAPFAALAAALWLLGLPFVVVLVMALAARERRRALSE